MENIYTEICYEPNKQQFMIDHTYSGIERDILCPCLAKVESYNGKIKLRILLEIAFTSKGKVIANIIKCDIEVK